MHLNVYMYYLVLGQLLVKLLIGVHMWCFVLFALISHCYTVVIGPAGYNHQLASQR